MHVPRAARGRISGFKPKKSGLTQFAMRYVCIHCKKRACRTRSGSRLPEKLCNCSSGTHFPDQVTLGEQKVWTMCEPLVAGVADEVGRSSSLWPVGVQEGGVATLLQLLSHAKRRQILSGPLASNHGHRLTANVIPLISHPRHVTKSKRRRRRASRSLRSWCGWRVCTMPSSCAATRSCDRSGTGRARVHEPSP